MGQVMSRETKAAIDAALKTFACEPMEIDGRLAVAIIDRSFPQPVATVLGVADDGSAIADRFTVVAEPDVAAMIEKGLTEVRLNEKRAPAKFSDVLSVFGRHHGHSFADHVVAWARIHFGAEVQEPAMREFAQALLSKGQAHAVLDRLNKDSLDSLAAVEEFSLSAYAFYAEQTRKGEYRRQAARSYPLFAADMAKSVRAKMAIDTGKALNDILMNLYGADAAGKIRLDPKLLKKFAGHTWRTRDVPVSTVIEVMSRLPVDWFPKSEDEWNAFIDLTGSFFQTLGPELEWDVVTMTGGSKGNWRQLTETVANAAADTRPPEGAPADWKPETDTSATALKEIAEGAAEVIRAFRNLVALPVAAASGGGVPVYLGSEAMMLAGETAGRILYGGRTLKSIVELSRHWHTQEHNIRNALGEEEPEIVRGKAVDIEAGGWAPMCDEWVAPNGVIVKPLTTTQELKNEGAGWSGTSSEIGTDGVRGLAFCVGGYTAQCKEGRSHIISFRMPTPDGSFTRLSAAEFSRFDRGSTDIKCVQHRGRGNGNPPAVAKDAYDWFVNSVRMGQIPLNYDGVMAYLSQTVSNREDVEIWCGFDWKDGEKVEKMFEPWGFYMPKRMRGIDVAGLQASAEMSELCQSIAPTYARAMTR